MMMPASAAARRPHADMRIGPPDDKPGSSLHHPVPHRKEKPMIKQTVLLAALAAAPALVLAAGFKLTSPDIQANGLIDQKFEANVFGCSGENKSPALKWSGAPKDTKSFAVTVYDPDAPTGSGFWHWFVYDIPAGTTELKADAGNASNANLPQGAKHNRIDYGFAAWGGPCPPEGDKPHRYVFTVYALKTDKLGLPADATAAVAGFMTHANTLAKASFTARYGRKKAKK
jgi:Raf kinase inhibitor-like YbhB/YbcL family protein